MCLKPNTASHSGSRSLSIKHLEICRGEQRVLPFSKKGVRRLCRPSLWVRELTIVSMRFKGIDTDPNIIKGHFAGDVIKEEQSWKKRRETKWGFNEGSVPGH